MPVHRFACLRHTLLVLLGALLTLQACAPATNRYALVEQRLRSGDYIGADQVIEQAEGEYGSKSRVLYDMDRGMTLHLAGKYQVSNARLEEAEHKVEELYTRRIRTETQAFLTNDTTLPYEGEPFEQVLLNVIKALNYAIMGQGDEALVEARRVDQRLNLLADRVEDEAEYRDDPFARYLSGILYEVTGDLNNAFIAYRNAYRGYQSTTSWSPTGPPPILRGDLLRMSDALGFRQQHETYRQEFSEVAWQTSDELKDLAQVIVISYNGLAPRKEDLFVDLPVSAEALNLVLLTKAATRSANSREKRATESLLYALNGRVVRVAVPRLVESKTSVAYSRVDLSGPAGPAEATTELVHDIGATAEKALDERLPAIATKAVARAATKFALAEGARYGAGKAAGEDAGPVIGALVGILAKWIAVASEEADKRSWRTLPDEIQLARLWMPPGEYELSVQAVNRRGTQIGTASSRSLTLQQGEARFVVERVLQ